MDGVLRFDYPDLEVHAPGERELPVPLLDKLVLVVRVEHPFEPVRRFTRGPVRDIIRDHVVDDHEVSRPLRVPEEQYVSPGAFRLLDLRIELEAHHEVHRDEIERLGVDEPFDPPAFPETFGPLQLVGHRVVGRRLTVDQYEAVRFGALHPFAERLVVCAEDPRILHEHVAVGAQDEARLVRVAVPPASVPALPREQDVLRTVEPRAHEHVPRTLLPAVRPLHSPVGSRQRKARRPLQRFGGEVRIVPRRRRDGLSHVDASLSVGRLEQPLRQPVSRQGRDLGEEARVIDVPGKRIVEGGVVLHSGQQHVRHELHHLVEHVVPVREQVEPVSPVDGRERRHLPDPHDKVPRERLVVGPLRVERVVHVHHGCDAALADPVGRVAVLFLKRVPRQPQRPPALPDPVASLGVSAPRRLEVHLLRAAVDRASNGFPLLRRHEVVQQVVSQRHRVQLEPVREKVVRDLAAGQCYQLGDGFGRDFRLIREHRVQARRHYLPRIGEHPNEAEAVLPHPVLLGRADLPPLGVPAKVRHDPRTGLLLEAIPDSRKVGGVEEDYRVLRPLGFHYPRSKLAVLRLDRRRAEAVPPPRSAFRARH